MDATPDPQLAARVAAWHNRHPLARRISAAQVQGMGVVALPFAASAGKKNKARGAFDEDFIAPLGASRVARFTLRHGTSTRPGPEDWPQRELSVRSGMAPNAATELRFLRTAAIDARNQRTRVLIGGGPRAEVLGQRLWSRPRVIAAMLIAGTLLAALAAALGRASAPAVHEGGMSVASATAASAAPPEAARQAASGVAVDVPLTPDVAASHTPTAIVATTAHEATAPASSAASSAFEPAHAATSTQQATQNIRPALSSEQRLAAQQEARKLRADKAADSGKATSSAEPASASGAGRIFAVATPPTRTRAAAQLRIVLMNAPTQAEPGQPHAEVMQVGAGWRTVVWPFNSREAAQQTREGLAARGIPAEVIEF